MRDLMNGSTLDAENKTRKTLFSRNVSCMKRFMESTHVRFNLRWMHGMVVVLVGLGRRVCEGNYKKR